MINGYKWDCHSINRAAIIDLELVFRSKKCGLRYHRFASGVRKLWRRRFRHSHSILAPLGYPNAAGAAKFQQSTVWWDGFTWAVPTKNNYIQLLYILIEGSLQSNFRQYGQMKQQRWEQSEKRKSQKKEDQCARKGRGVVKHCVFPIFCGSGGSK